MKIVLFISFFISLSIAAQVETAVPESSPKVETPNPEVSQKAEVKKDNVLDFSAGVIEGDLNRPSMLMELGSNYKEFNDLVLMREDFNTYHDTDSKFRFRYVDENL